MTGYQACRIVLAGLAVGCAVLTAAALNSGDDVLAVVLALTTVALAAAVAVVHGQEREARARRGMDAGPAMRLFGVEAGSGEDRARHQLGIALGRGEVGRVSFTVERGEASGELRDTLELEFAHGTFVVSAPRLMHSWRPRPGTLR